MDTNKSAVENVFRKLMYIFFFLLLWWPVYRELSYMFLQEPLRDSLGTMIIYFEIAFGALTIIMSIRRTIEWKNLGSRILTGIVFLSYAAFLGSLYYLLVLHPEINFREVGADIIEWFLLMIGL